VAQQEIDNQAQDPWQSVVYIEATFPDGYGCRGSGVMVGPNDVLTASHVVYDIEHGGEATNVTVTPAFDGDPYEAPFGTVDAYDCHYFTDFDPDGDGFIYNGNAGAGFGGVEHDVAVLDLNVALGNDTGWMELDPTFESGQVNLTGYPGIDGQNMMNEVGNVQQDAVDYFIPIENLERHPGNSGGPLWYFDDNGVPNVVGIVSTTVAAYDIAAEYDTVSGWIASNDGLIGIA
jgi:V8-like Glu-specific endopeptidase